MSGAAESEPYAEEAFSVLAMMAVATWTTSAGAQRALTMRNVLRASGESQPVLDEVFGCGD